MAQDISFKICLALSVCFHLAIMSPWQFPHNISRPKPRFKQIELTYVTESPLDEAVVRDIEPIVSIEEKGRKVAIKQKPIIELRKKRITIKRHSGTAKKKLSHALEARIENHIAKDSKGIKPKRWKALDNYYFKIRGLVKSSLQKNARRFVKEGEVYVRFIIRRDGSLKDLLIYKRAKQNFAPLEKIAIRSIKDAAPFPPFGRAITESELPFDLPISFSLENRGQ